MDRNPILCNAKRGNFDQLSRLFLFLVHQNDHPSGGSLLSNPFSRKINSYNDNRILEMYKSIDPTTNIYNYKESLKINLTLYKSFDLSADG